MHCRFEQLEDNIDLQARAARAIAALIDLCTAPESTMRVNPAPKLVGNLCAFLCQDTAQTPLFASVKSQTETVLTLAHAPARGTVEKPTKGQQPGDSDAADTAAKLVYRGASRAITELTQRFGIDVLDRVPKLWSCMADPLVAVFGQGKIHTTFLLLQRSAHMAHFTGDSDAADEALRAEDRKGQDVLDSLTILPVAASRLDPALHSRLAALLPALASASRSTFAVVRYAVARSFAAVCDIIPVDALRQIVETVIPVLADPLHAHYRRGAMELIGRESFLSDALSPQDLCLVTTQMSSICSTSRSSLTLSSSSYPSSGG